MCCSFLLYKENSIFDGFFDEKRTRIAYMILWFFGFVFYLVYFGLIVDQSISMDAIHHSKYYYTTGQILFGPEQSQLNLNNLDECQIYNEHQASIISDYLNQHTKNQATAHFTIGFIGALFCFLLTFPIFLEDSDFGFIIKILCCFCIFDSGDYRQSKNFYRQTKYYDGVFLTLLFTSGTVVGFSPFIFITIADIGDGFLYQAIYFIVIIFFFSCTSYPIASKQKPLDLYYYCIQLYQNQEFRNKSILSAGRNILLMMSGAFANTQLDGKSNLEWANNNIIEQKIHSKSIILFTRMGKVKKNYQIIENLQEKFKYVTLITILDHILKISCISFRNLIAVA
ncbi:hypothetical protein ABPG72_022193 [Tetrahymena utriculariae]